MAYRALPLKDRQGNNEGKAASRLPQGFETGLCQDDGRDLQGGIPETVSG